MAIYIGPPRTEQELEQYYQLRWEVLRAHWGGRRGSERDDLESNAEHVLVADEEGCVLAVGRLHLNTSTEAQIRYMATTPKHQSYGLGTRVAGELETLARRAGATSIVLNARLEAIPFYERMGYAVVEEGPTMFGTVRHAKMQKLL